MLGIVTGSIRGKLYALVIALIAASVVVGLVGMYKLNQMNDRLNDMADISAEKVKLSARIRQDLLAITRAEKALMLTSDPEEQQALADRIERNRDEMNQRREQLRAMLTGAEREELGEFAAAWDSFLELHRDVRELALENSNHRAMLLSRNEAREAFEALESELKAIDAESQTALKKYRQSDNPEVQAVLELSDQSRIASNLLRSAVEFQRAEKNIILAERTEAMKQYAQQAEQIEQRIEGRFARLGQTLDGNLQKKLETARAEYEAYLAHNQEILKLSLANTTNRAAELSATRGRELIKECETQITDIAEHAIANMDKDKAASDRSFTAAIWLMSSLILLAGAASGALAWFIVSGITKGIGRVVVRARAIAEKDLTGEPMAVKTKDEVGQLTETVNAMSVSLQQIVGEVTQSAQEVASAATEIASNAEELSTGIDEQTTQMAQVASAVEEMSASITEVASKSTDASGSAKQSGEVATEGSEVVGQTVQGMESISEAVSASAVAVESLGKRGQQIGEVIDVINDIADQTNLLALNAAIEAARAGEHGRGFAVVADEVRKLADRTTKATEEIGESIQAIQTETTEAVDRMNTGTQQVQTGVELATRAGNSLNEIVGSAQSVSDMIASIASAAEQQAAASEEISRSIQSVDAITRQSSEASSQSATAATQLSSKAETLQQLVAEFKVNA